MLRKIGLNASSSYLKQNLISRWPYKRIFCTLYNTGEYELGPLQVVRNRNAQKWLDNLDPEMQKKKDYLEIELELQKVKGFLSNYEIQPTDIKHILTDCESIEDAEVYLLATERTFTTRQNRQKYKKIKDEETWRLENSKTTHPDSFSYMIFSEFYNQRARWYDYRAASSLLNDPTPVVFDMGYDTKDKEQRNAAHEMFAVFNFNNSFADPCAIHVTDNRNSVFHDQLEAGVMRSEGLTMHEESVTEVFPREKLVYITPYGPPLKRHIPGDIYVIPGIVDLLKNDGMTIEKAKHLNIRHGSFPFTKYGLDKRPFATDFGVGIKLSHYFELVSNINLFHDWGYVMNVIKKRHGLKDLRKKQKFEGFL